MTKSLQEGKALKGGRSQASRQTKPQAPKAQPNENAEQDIKQTIEKQCIRCDFNTKKYAASIPKDVTVQQLNTCPHCQQELYIVKKWTEA